MKIALLTPTFSQFSGIDRVVELDSEEYTSKGNEVTIFSLGAAMKPKRAKLVVMGMPKNPALERIYRLFFFLDVFKIRKYVKMLGSYEKVIAYFYPMTWLGYKAKKKYGIKYIYWNAGIAYPGLFKKITEKIYLKLFLHYVKKSVSNADGAISISKFMQKELKRETGLDSIVKYIKIDSKRFHKRVKGDGIRKKYGIKKDEKVFLYVGRISPHKGVHLLIKAFKKVQEKIKKSKLIIVGKPTFDKYLKELKQIANKDVIFAGFVNDEELPEYYAACNVYATASRWEGYDMPVCLPPSSKINLNLSYKNIESIKSKDLVLTHNHNYREVIKTTKRPYRGDLMNIYCFGYSQPLKLTPEHKVYCIQTKKCKRSKICKPACLKKEECNRRYFEKYSPKWLEANGIKKGDVLVLPYKNAVKDKNSITISRYIKGIEKGNKSVFYKYSRKADKGKETYLDIGRKLGVSKNAIYRVINNLKKEIDKDKFDEINSYLKKIGYQPRSRIKLRDRISLSKDIMRLFGYYLAEGCAPKSGNVICFSFNSKEKLYYNDVVSLIKSAFNLECSLEIKKNKCRISCSSKILNGFFKKLFGENTKTKSIPEFMISLPNYKLAELLKGAWRGDGHKYFSYSSSSKKLAYQIKDILLRLGIHSYLKQYRRKENSTEYEIKISASYYQKLCEILGLKYKPNKKRRTHSLCWIDDKFIYNMVRKTKKTNYLGFVYNLEIENDKSYCTDIAALHNCEAQACGKKVVAFDCCSHPEVVKKGILVRDGDITGFAKAMVKL